MSSSWRLLRGLGVADELPINCLEGIKEILVIASDPVEIRTGYRHVSICVKHGQGLGWSPDLLATYSSQLQATVHMH